MATKIEQIPAIVRLARSTNVDLDSLDGSLAQRLIDLGVRPMDQTSNQVLIVAALLLPINLPFIQSVCEELHAEAAAAGLTEVEWKAVLDRVSVLLCKKNESLISGRFLLQTSPRDADDAKAIAAHARNYAREFEKAGFSRDRFCIKLPATGAGVTAAATLEKEGIRTLGTSLFSVPQALACSQAGCLSISPYFNAIPAHDRSTGLWPDVPDPAIQHPMSPRMVQIFTAYKALFAATGRPQPMIKAASNISMLECLAVAEELGAHHITILPNVLEQLMTTSVSSQPEVSGITQGRPAFLWDPATERPLTDRTRPLLEIDPLSPGGKPFPFDVHAVPDYLSNGGAALEEAIARDLETAKRIEESLDLFRKAEEVARQAIERVLDGKGIEGITFSAL